LLNSLNHYNGSPRRYNNYTVRQTYKSSKTIGQT
jgi:hypothetical protein